jgi:hypothetical protein
MATKGTKGTKEKKERKGERAKRVGGPRTADRKKRSQ